jgi:hypothetical protein
LLDQGPLLIHTHHPVDNIHHLATFARPTGKTWPPTSRYNGRTWYQTTGMGPGE